MCTISSNVVTFVGAGTCTLDANQAGNTDYAAASQVTQSFSVSALTILSVQPPSSGRATFEGTGSSGSTAVTVTVCNEDVFPCPSGHVVTSVSTSTSPGNPWTTGRSSNVFTTNDQYYAQAAEGSVTSAVFPFVYESTEPEPENVSLANNGTSGMANAGDTATVTFSEPLDASTICGAWANNGTTQSISDATLSLSASSSDSQLTVTSSATCGSTLNFGTVLTESGYASTTATFTNSTITWNPTTYTLTFTLGTQSGGTVRNGEVNSTPEYTADAQMTDLSGNAAYTSPVTGTSSRF